MNKRARNRLIGVSAIILLIAVVGFYTLSTGDNQANKTVAEVLGDDAIAGQRVKIAGTVVDDSWDGKANPMRFSVRDDENPDGPQLKVVYSGTVPSSFGNKTKAILTGELKDGEFVATDMLTQCPSKYQSGTAETVDQMIAQGDAIVGKPIKVMGVVASEVASGTFTLQASSAGGGKVQVTSTSAFTAERGQTVEVSGSLGKDGVFNATGVAPLANTPAK